MCLYLLELHAIVFFLREIQRVVVSCSRSTVLVRQGRGSGGRPSFPVISCQQRDGTNTGRTRSCLGKKDLAQESKGKQRMEGRKSRQQSHQFLSRQLLLRKSNTTTDHNTTYFPLLHLTPSSHLTLVYRTVWTPLKP